MVEAANIQPHMEVRDSEGASVGKVDGLEGDRIKLTRVDSPDGQHHYVAMDDVERVDEHVHLAAGVTPI